MGHAEDLEVAFQLGVGRILVAGLEELLLGAVVGFLMVGAVQGHLGGEGMAGGTWEA